MRRLAPLLLLLTGCPDRATPARYEFPLSFSGKFAVEYGVPGAPPLPVDGERRVARLDARGYLATSSPLSTGVVNDQFARVDPSGKAVALHMVPCSGSKCRLEAGEATLLGTGALGPPGRRDFEFGAVGPCVVDFGPPTLPPR